MKSNLHFKIISFLFVCICSMLVENNSAIAADGDQDMSFLVGNIMGFDADLSSIALQQDGKIIVGGGFTSYNGTARHSIARLNADSTLDTSFDPGNGSGYIRDVAIDSDGKIIIGGDFTSYNGTVRNHIARLNTDGSLDTNFDPGTVVSNSIHSLALQSDGKVIIGGSFISNADTVRNNIVRLNTDGSLDTSFDPGTAVNGPIHSLALQSDGKIIIGGVFSINNSISYNNIARLNTDGSLDTSFDPGMGAEDQVESIAIQSDGKIIIGGSFTSYNGTVRNHIARLNTDGSLDTSFDPGSSISESHIILTTIIQSDGKIIIGGDFTSYNGTLRNRIARLNTDGSLDTSFDPGMGADGEVESIAIQSDGKIIIGGLFEAFDGDIRMHIARLDIDGSIDIHFNPGTGANNNVDLTVIQPDGKIIIGGDFTSYNGTLRNRIARLNTDGSLDTSFDPGTSVNAPLRSLVLQSDGKIIVGGYFNSCNDIVRYYIARINTDGSLDTSFDPGTSVSSSVHSLALQSDGKIIIGGDFTSYNGTVRNHIARLNTDGSLDTSFDPGMGADGEVESIAIQSDGKIIIGGLFEAFDGDIRMHIARLNTDGSLDTSFDPGIGTNSTIVALSLQSDGKIIIGGSFTSYNSTARDSIARLNTDGSLDTSFDPGDGVGGLIKTIKIQTDNKVIIGGYFTSYNGTFRNHIARINTDGSLDTSFDPRNGFGSAVSSLDIQADNKIIACGSFTTYDNAPAAYVTRIIASSADITPAEVDVTITPDNIIDISQGSDSFVFTAEVTDQESGGGSLDAVRVQLPSGAMASANAGAGMEVIPGGERVWYGYSIPQGNEIGTGYISVDISNAAGVETTVENVATLHFVESVDPVLTQITSVPSPSNDPTPNYTFNTTEAGTITYGGDCSSATTTATVGDNTITFNELSFGTYDNCTITVTDTFNNVSNILTVSSFIVDIAPVLTEVSAIPPSTVDPTPNYTFNTTEAGTITYGGDCSSATTTATVGDNTITFNELSFGTYSNCTITVLDDVNYASNILAIREFTVTDALPPSTVLTQTTAVPSPTTDPTPNYTFNTTEAGTITYGGDCSSTTTTATVGDNTITFNALADGVHSNCTIMVTDHVFWYESNTLAVNTFTIDATPPMLTQVTAVPSPTNDSTPSYTFQSSEDVSEHMSYSGACGMPVTVNEIEGISQGGGDPIFRYTITYDTLNDETYDDCIIVAQDDLGNISAPLAVNTFTIDATPPTLTQVTAVPSPSNDPTPNYTFNTTEAGTITYGGDCSSATTTATVGDNTITFDALDNGVYENCTIVVTDVTTNASNALSVSAFTVEVVAPVLAEVTPVSTPTTDTTPEYTFSSTKAGVIHYGGECDSDIALANVGDNVITFNELSVGTYDDCVIAVEDADENMSEFLQISTFVIKSQDVDPDPTEEKEIPKPDLSFSGKLKDAVLSSKKKLYIEDDEVKFKGNYPEIAGGKVVIKYKKGSDDEEEIVDVDQNGNWSKKIEFDEDGSYKIKFTFFDKDGNEVGEKGYYKIKIDTEDPKLADMPSKLTKRAGDKIWWSATDNEEIDEYKYYFNGKKEKTDDPFFFVSKDTPKGTYILEIRAYDKAGNKDVKHVTIVVR